MIRRGFWLAAGAVTGIYGYRRVSAMGRRLSASLSPAAGPRPAARSARARRNAIVVAGEAYRFTRDVREGMELYRLAHSAPTGSTLSTGRSADRPTHHDARPEDGH